MHGDVVHRLSGGPNLDALAQAMNNVGKPIRIAVRAVVQTINFGLTVQASTGATREELLRVVEIALKGWPN